MSDSKEETKGLDITESSIYIKHVSNKKIWKIPETAATHSKLLREGIIDNTNNETYGKVESNPMIITSILDETLPFIIRYLLHYNNKVEKVAPESPIKNIHISVIFGDEYELFSDIYSKTDSLKEIVIKINNIIEASLYFDFKYLHKKLCAIIASLLLNVDIDNLKDLLK
jgi:hypothetical protein